MKQITANKQALSDVHVLRENKLLMLEFPCQGLGLDMLQQSQT